MLLAYTRVILSVFEVFNSGLETDGIEHQDKQIVWYIKTIQTIYKEILNYFFLLLFSSSSSNSLGKYSRNYHEKRASFIKQTKK